ncbi:hypothetical protein [Desulfospira joergensenii]|uniref:hypothetical protein n=1 Tax=Desulfospira joergensenii TaxID=53329 RepID=UPI0012946BD4|nr:hypothetical protein [Desulfospira joergensenii]
MIPGSWEVERLDQTYMLIGEEESPKLEIKWTVSPRRFTLETYLKDFTARTQKQLDIQIKEEAFPPLFSHPQGRFEFFFFSWQGGGAEGKGVVLFCNQCKKLSLVRFFSGISFSSNSLADRILQSYSDHPGGELSRWTIFGMDFSIPSAYALTDYRFQPGSFSMTFSSQKTSLTVFSWGPASFLLSKIDLNGFARQRLPRLKGLALTGECRRGSFLEWAFTEEPFTGAGRLPIFNRYSRPTVFRICRDRKDNRIFGILAQSFQQFEHGLIRESFLGDL